MTAVWTPMLVAEPSPAFRSVKLAELLLGILDGLARQAFVHWAARAEADSSAEATPTGSFRVFVLRPTLLRIRIAAALKRIQLF